MRKAHDFPEIYKGLGLNLNTLGCVMLDLEPIPMPTWIAQDYFTGTQSNLNQFIEPVLHKSPNKERFWIDGYVADKVPHVTLRYGLLHTAKNYQSQIEQLLSDWKIGSVQVEKFGYFDSPYADEDYYCVIGHLALTPELLDGHERLGFLPHVNTFMGYKPHVTMFYMKKETVDNKDMRDWLIQELNGGLAGRELKVKGINYGGDK